MKVGPECPACLVGRGLLEVQKATGNRGKQLQTMLKIIKLMEKKLGEKSVPAEIGTLRDRIIRLETKNPDPYRFIKAESNKLALKLLPKLRRKIRNRRDSYRRFKIACMYSTVGNKIEFDIPDYKFSLNAVGEALLETNFGIDHSKDVYMLLRKIRNVLFLTDNAGEIVFDKLLIEQLKNIGAKVTVAVKDGPVLNDATLEDVYQVRMTEIADEVLSIGSDTVGLMIKYASKKFLSRLSEAELLVAKGMGHYETLTEEGLKIPTLHLLVAKCNPVARSIGVKKGEAVILLAKPMK